MDVAQLLEILARGKDSANQYKRDVTNVDALVALSNAAGGLLLIGKQPQTLRPAFMVKAVAVNGTALHDTTYADSEGIDGNLPAQYQRSLACVRRNLHHMQADQPRPLAQPSDGRLNTLRLVQHAQPLAGVTCHPHPAIVAWAARAKGAQSMAPHHPARRPRVQPICGDDLAHRGIDAQKFLWPFRPPPTKFWFPPVNYIPSSPNQTPQITTVQIKCELIK